MHGKADRFADASLATLRRFTSIVSGRLLRTGNTDHTVDNYHLLSLLREAGCPICNERSESERVHFFWLLNESCQQPMRIPVNWSTDSGGSGPASESLTQV
jgi:hypothetical protein